MNWELITTPHLSAYIIKPFVTWLTWENLPEWLNQCKWSLLSNAVQIMSDLITCGMSFSSQVIIRDRAKRMGTWCSDQPWNAAIRVVMVPHKECTFLSPSYISSHRKVNCRNRRQNLCYVTRASGPFVFHNWGVLGATGRTVKHWHHLNLYNSYEFSVAIENGVYAKCHGIKPIAEGFHLISGMVCLSSWMMPNTE